MGQAKQRGTFAERVLQAKLKNKHLPPHIQSKLNGEKLASWYWGYKADQGVDGFEFSIMTLTEGFGMPYKVAMKIGEEFKEASDHQLQVFLEDRTQEEYGLSRDEFIQEEWERLQEVLDYFKNEVYPNKIAVADTLRPVMVACCAISTLVAAGKIEQNEWNGDKFGYVTFGSKEIAKMFEETA